jgi:hypothetical protein
MAMREKAWIAMLSWVGDSRFHKVVKAIAEKTC